MRAVKVTTQVGVRRSPELAAYIDLAKAKEPFLPVSQLLERAALRALEAEFGPLETKESKP